jgi:LCP family protein required for cell wall assembly
MIMTAVVKSKKKNGIKWLIVLAAVVLAALVFYVWQRSYFTLPEGEVKAGIDGEETPAAAAGIDKFDILLLGLDSREGQPGLGERSDTILLVTLDTKENRARILSIPRDTRVKYQGSWLKINEVYSYDGPQGSVEAVQDLLNTSIDRYAVVDFSGVIQLIDLMDGVDVNVPKDMQKLTEGIDLKQGQQHLNGYDALAYMRYRDNVLSDMDRSERQKEVLLQLAEKILQPANLLKLPTISDTALSYMKTDISVQEIVALAKSGKALLNNGVENQVLPGSNEYYNGGWYYVAYLEELGLPMSEAEKEFRQIMSQAAQQVQPPTEPQEGAGESQEGSGETQEGTGETQEGTGETQEGTGETQEGTGETQEGTRETQEGTGETQEGTGETQEGTGETQEGSGETQDGTGEPQDGAGEPQDGAGETQEGSGETQQPQESTGQSQESPSEPQGSPA